jgi:hypothetical protein
MGIVETTASRQVVIGERTIYQTRIETPITNVVGSGAEIIETRLITPVSITSLDDGALLRNDGVILLSKPVNLIDALLGFTFYWNHPSGKQLKIRQSPIGMENQDGGKIQRTIADWGFFKGSPLQIDYTIVLPGVKRLLALTDDQKKTLRELLV